MESETADFVNGLLNAIAGDASIFFKMPPSQVVELGIQIEI